MTKQASGLTDDDQLVVEAAEAPPRSPKAQLSSILDEHSPCNPYFGNKLETAAVATENPAEVPAGLFFHHRLIHTC